MTDREKLIELLETVVSPKKVLCDGEVLVSTAKVANHLIANGVTIQNSTPEMEVICERIIDSPRKGWLYQARFIWCGKDWFVERKLPENLIAESAAEQKWIPVTERLPEEGERVLFTDGVWTGEGYINKRGKWQRYQNQSYMDVITLDVTHWIPLPEPPKGEGS